MPVVYPLPWPLDSKGLLIRPKQISLSVAQVSRSGGQTYTGVEQVVASPGMRWEGKLSFPQMDRATLLNWRGFVAAMQGRVGSVLVPVFEAGRQPWPVRYGRRITPDYVRFPRLRGTPYAIDAANDPVIQVATRAAAMNATSLTLDVALAGLIQAGHRFSIAGSLYEIMQADQNEDGSIAVDIRPWLRADIPAGTSCEFAMPVLTARFKTDAEGALDLEVGRFANPEVNVVEAF